MTAPVPPPSPTARWRRRAGWTAAGMLAALVAGLAACEVLGWPFLRPPLERQLAQRLQREVAIGSDFRLRLLGRLRVHTDQLRIGSPAWAAEAGQAPDFVQAQGVHLALSYAALLSAWRQHGDEAPPLRIQALEVDTIKATLWRLADGRANWQLGPPPPANRPSTRPQVPAFGRLVVGQGRLRYDDAMQRIQLRAEARTDEGRQAGGQAHGLLVTGEGRWRDARVEFRLAASGALPLVAPDHGARPVPVALRASAGRATYTFEGHTVDVLRLQGFDGAFTARGDSLAAAGAPWGITLPSTPPFQLHGRLAKDGAVWQATVRQATVGRSRLAGRFTFDRRPEVPLLSGTLNGDRLVLADLGPAFGAGGGTDRRTARASVLPRREFNLPALRAMDADVRVDLRELDLGTAYLRDLRPVGAHVRLQDGVLRVEDLSATTSGGTLQAGLVLDSRPDVPRWDVNLALSGVRLEQWLQARNPRAEQARSGQPAPPYVTGVLGARAAFQGQGRSTAAMLGSLQGTASLWVREGQLSHLVVEASGIDLAETLGLMLSGDRQLPMQCAVMRFVAREGLLRSELGLVDTPDTTVLINGNVSLAQEQLDLQVMAHPKDFSPLSLRSPIRLHGSFSQPQVQLDAGRIGLKVLAAAALAAITPLAAVIPLIDPGGATTQGCEQALQRLRSARTGQPAPAAPGKP
ncbi:AsmA family protein [Caldimonas thermodepolymerans]|uniref:AsmA family protein n=1 Tax=Caldimonas thermodepolymerans TaxID=215580 RepID=UPI00248F9F3A|nr:AsmA family protein [Caldimonas thermodepolymerans]